MARLSIIANIITRADEIDMVKAELEKLIDINRAEEGCLQCDPYQDNENPPRFMPYQNWESPELWQAHMSAQHLQDYMTATEGAIEGFTLNDMAKLV